jgi:hypothetical protein
VNIDSLTVVIEEPIILPIEVTCTFILHILCYRHLKIAFLLLKL